MPSSPADADVFCHQDIVDGAQRGEPDAFRALYETHAPRLLSYLRAMVGDRDAEDVASETWVRIHNALPTYHRNRGDFRTWSTVIARNQAISYLRYHRARPSFPMPPDAFPQRPSPADTARDAAEAMRTARALALLRELPRGQATAVLLCVVIGMDAVSAGRILRKQPNAVRTAVHRGLKALRVRIGNGNDTDAAR
jgi:RNA polymerase sigma-70 factor (ECF subfamily)